MAGERARALAGSLAVGGLVLIHDLLFLPISTIESGVSERVVTHSPIRAWLVHA